MSSPSELSLRKADSNDGRFRVGRIVHHNTLMLEMLFYVPRNQRIQTLLYISRKGREFVQMKWKLMSRPDPMQLDFASLIECDPNKELAERNFEVTNHF